MDKQQNQTEIINKILTGTRWVLALRLSGQTFSWLVTIIVVRFISPEDYGIKAMLDASLELLVLFCTLGLELALVRSKQIDENQLRSVFGWLLIINGLLFLAYFFGGGLIADYFNEPRLEPLTQVLAFTFLLVPFRVIPNALLDRDLKFGLRAIAEFIASVSASIVMLVLAIWGYGVWALVMGFLANRILQTAILMFLQPWITMPSLNLSVIRPLMAFGIVLSSVGIVVRITNQLIPLIGGPVLGAELLGIFVISFYFAMLPLSKIMPIINSIVFPAFSKFQDQRDAISHYFIKSLGIVALGLFPIMIGIACISHEFVAVVLGDKWSDVAVPLTLLSIVMPLKMVAAIILPILSSVGRVDLSLRFSIIALIIQLPLVIIGINYEVIGLVMATLVTELIIALITIGMSNAVLNTSFIKIEQSLRPAVVSSAVMAACVLGIKFALDQQYGMTGLLIEIGVGAISYYLTLRIFYHQLLENAIGLLLKKR